MSFEAKPAQGIRDSMMHVIDGVPRHGSRSLEVLLSERRLTREQALHNDWFIRRAVYDLSNSNPFKDEYYKFLLEAGSQRTANYLTPAFDSPDRVGIATNLFLNYGPSAPTAMPLVRTLRSHSPTSVNAAKSILISYGKEAWQWMSTNVKDPDHLYGALLEVIIATGAQDDKVRK